MSTDDDDRLCVTLGFKTTGRDQRRLDSICQRARITRGHFLRVVMLEALALCEAGELRIPMPDKVVG